MTRLELLSSMLDMKAVPSEVGSAQQTFSQALPFWRLCMEAKRLLNEQQASTTKKQVTNDKDKQGGDTKVAR